VHVERKRLLAGDIGGTKSLLGVFEHDGTRLIPVVEDRYESRRFDGIATMARPLLARAGGTIDVACFGIAGPVVGEECRALNLPWMIHRMRLAEEIGVARTLILNDFQAAGRGLEHLAPDDTVPLQEGTPAPRGTIALIGAGTGLGEGFITQDGDRRFVHPSEGGHADFAPRSAIEWRLRERLARQHGHVSYERILSGAGLEELYSFVVDSGLAPGSRDVRAEMDAGDPAAVVTSRSAAGTDPACRQALRLFVSIYGAEAGNLALKVMAAGGVYLAGGIAPRIVATLRDGEFIRSFRDKGRHEPFLESIPVRVVVNDRVGLLGAAAAAAEAAPLA